MFADVKSIDSQAKLKTGYSGKLDLPNHKYFVHSEVGGNWLWGSLPLLWEVVLSELRVLLVWQVDLPSALGKLA